MATIREVAEVLVRINDEEAKKQLPAQITILSVCIFKIRFNLRYIIKLNLISRNECNSLCASLTLPRASLHQ